jgi:hypothetical protein
MPFSNAQYKRRRLDALALALAIGREPDFFITRTLDHADPLIQVTIARMELNGSLWAPMTPNFIKWYRRYRAGDRGCLFESTSYPAVRGDKRSVLTMMVFARFVLPATCGRPSQSLSRCWVGDRIY